MAVEGEFPKVDGDILFASEVNLLVPIRQVYSATGFDSSQSGSGTDEQSHELDAVSSSFTKSANYVRITFLGTPDGNAATDETINVSLKAQIKETGQSYADMFAYNVVYFSSKAIGSPATFDRTDGMLSFVFPLTSGMKTNGFQITAFSKSVSTGGTSSWTNIQTVVELL